MPSIESSATIPPGVLREAMHDTSLTMVVTVKARMPWDVRLRLWVMMRLLDMVALVIPCDCEIVKEEADAI